MVHSLFGLFQFLRGKLRQSHKAYNYNYMTFPNFVGLQNKINSKVT